MSIHGRVISFSLRAPGWSGNRAWPRLEKLCRGRVLNVGAGAHRFGETCDIKVGPRGYVCAKLDLLQGTNDPKYLCNFEAVAVGQVPAPFPLSSFDTVLMSDVLEHMVMDKGALALAYQLLNLGGEIVVRTPSMHSWSQLSFSLRGKPMVEKPGTTHVRDGYTACALKMRLRDVGFRDIRRVSPYLSEELVMVGVKR